jgi:hypothetical protein
MVEPNFGTDLLPHFTDSAAETASATVSDSGVESLVTCLQENVQHHFLGDGVSDLNGAAGDGFAFVGQFDTAEGGPMNAVTAVCLYIPNSAFFGWINFGAAGVSLASALLLWAALPAGSPRVEFDLREGRAGDGGGEEGALYSSLN